MSAAATATNDAPSPGRFTFVVGLIRQLIDFGQQLAAAFHQPEIPNPVTAATRFGADTIPAILARIARGLLRAQVLYDRLLRCAARPERKPRSTPTPHQPRASRPAPLCLAATAPDPAQPATAEQIAAEDRRRPIGAVVADICRDLGIMPRHPLWRDVMRALGLHRGNAVALFNDALERLFSGPGWQAAMRAMFPEPTPPTAPATGPP